MISVREEKDSPVVFVSTGPRSTRAERRPRHQDQNTEQEKKRPTKGILRIETLVHAPSSSASSSPEYAMCATPHLRFPDPGLGGALEPSLPHLRQKKIFTLDMLQT